MCFFQHRGWLWQVGEVGELSEIFQWRGDTVANGLVGFSSEDKRHVGEEMSDVSLCCHLCRQVFVL